MKKWVILCLAVLLVLILVFLGIYFFGPGEGWFSDGSLDARPVMSEDYILTRDMGTSDTKASSGSGLKDVVSGSPVLNYSSPGVAGTVDPDSVDWSGDSSGVADSEVTEGSGVSSGSVESGGSGGSSVPVVLQPVPELQELPVFSEVDVVIDVLEEDYSGEVYPEYREEIDRYLAALLESKERNFRYAWYTENNVQSVNFSELLSYEVRSYNDVLSEGKPVVLVPFQLSTVEDLSEWVPLYDVLKDRVSFMFVNTALGGSESAYEVGLSFSELGFDFISDVWYDQYGFVPSVMTSLGVSEFVVISQFSSFVGGSSKVPTLTELTELVDAAVETGTDYDTQLNAMRMAFYESMEYLYYTRLVYCLERDEVDFKVEFFPISVQPMVQAALDGLSYDEFLALGSEVGDDGVLLS